MKQVERCSVLEQNEARLPGVRTNSPIGSSILAQEATNRPVPTSSLSPSKELDTKTVADRHIGGSWAGVAKVRSRRRGLMKVWSGFLVPTR